MDFAMRQEILSRLETIEATLGIKKKDKGDTNELTNFEEGAILGRLANNPNAAKELLRDRMWEYNYLALTQARSLLHMIERHGGNMVLSGKIMRTAINDLDNVMSAIGNPFERKR